MKVSAIFDFLNSFAPVSIQESFDNAGFLFGDKNADTDRVLLSLDCTSEVIEEAISKGCGLIITHHPLIWGSFKNVLADNSTGKKLLKLGAAGISVISMHTNLDKVLVNDVLAERIGLNNITGGTEDEMMRIGTLNAPCPISSFLKSCKEALNANGIRYYDSGREVYKIACLGGAGGEFINEAFNLGCDTYITADCPHHIFLEAKELGINLIDANHFCEEDPVMYALQTKLTSQFPGVSFSVADNDKQVIEYA